MVRPYHLILHRAKLGFPRLDRLRAYRQRRGAGKRHSTTCVWQPPDPLPSIDSPPPFTRLTSLFDPLAYLNICLVQTTKGSWQNTMIEGTEPIFTTVFTFEVCPKQRTPAPIALCDKRRER